MSAQGTSVILSITQLPPNSARPLCRCTLRWHQYSTFRHWKAVRGAGGCALFAPAAPPVFAAAAAGPGVVRLAGVTASGSARPGPRLYLLIRLPRTSPGEIVGVYYRSNRDKRSR